jgi:hypothetical protein
MCHGLTQGSSSTMLKNIYDTVADHIIRLVAVFAGAGRSCTCRSPCKLPTPEPHDGQYSSPPRQCTAFFVAQYHHQPMMAYNRWHNDRVRQIGLSTPFPLINNPNYAWKARCPAVQVKHGTCCHVLFGSDQMSASLPVSGSGTVGPLLTCQRCQSLCAV